MINMNGMPMPTNPEAGPNDVVPAMLTPGEAVIPMPAAQNPANKPMINAMINEGRVANQIMDGDTSVPQMLPVPQTVSPTDSKVADMVKLADTKNSIANSFTDTKIGNKLKEKLAEIEINMLVEQIQNAMETERRQKALNASMLNGLPPAELQTAQPNVPMPNQMAPIGMMDGGYVKGYYGGTPNFEGAFVGAGQPPLEDTGAVPQSQPPGVATISGPMGQPIVKFPGSETQVPTVPLAAPQSQSPGVATFVGPMGQPIFEFSDSEAQVPRVRLRDFFQQNPNYSVAENVERLEKINPIPTELDYINAKEFAAMRPLNDPTVTPYTTAFETQEPPKFTKAFAEAAQENMMEIPELPKKEEGIINEMKEAAVDVLDPSSLTKGVLTYGIMQALGYDQKTSGTAAVNRYSRSQQALEAGKIAEIKDIKERIKYAKRVNQNAKAQANQADVKNNLDAQERFRVERLKAAQSDAALQAQIARENEAIKSGNAKARAEAQRARVEYSEKQKKEYNQAFNDFLQDGRSGIEDLDEQFNRKFSEESGNRTDTPEIKLGKTPVWYFEEAVDYLKDQGVDFGNPETAVALRNTIFSSYKTMLDSVAASDGKFSAESIIPFYEMTVLAPQTGNVVNEDGTVTNRFRLDDGNYVSPDVMTDISETLDVLITAKFGDGKKIPYSQRANYRRQIMANANKGFDEGLRSDIAPIEGSNEFSMYLHDLFGQEAGRLKSKAK